MPNLIIRIYRFPSSHNKLTILPDSSKATSHVFNSPAGAPRIGFAAVPAAQVAQGELIEGWIDMKDEEGNDVQMRGKKVRYHAMHFIRVLQAALAHNGRHFFLQ